MKLETLNLKLLAAVPVLALVFLLSPSSAKAFTETQTVANIAAGTNNQTNATTSTTANVVETKATRTITINAVPAVPDVFTIAGCAITVTSVITSDVNCNDNTAAIATSTDTTAALIAARIRTFTNMTDTGGIHGPLTVGGSGVTASFTTTGTETSPNPISAQFNSGTSADVTLNTVNTFGVVPVAQVWAVTPANVETDDTFTTIINGTTVSFTATAATVANVTAGLTAAINASAVASAVTASDQSTFVRITADTAGTAFTVTSSGTNRVVTAQVVTFAPEYFGNINYTIALNGIPYTFRGSPGVTAKEVVEGMAAALVGNPAASCSEDDVKVTCTALSAGTAFTYSSEEARPGSGNGGSHHSSGGSSKSRSSANGSSSDTSSLQSKIDALKMQLAALMAKIGNTNSNAGVPVAAGIYARDLEVGATGTDVKALQAYLNAKGFTVAMAGSGSIGQETMTFGGATKAALAKFQKAKGIMPASGFFGPKTRAYVVANP